MEEAPMAAMSPSDKLVDWRRIGVDRTGQPRRRYDDVGRCRFFVRPPRLRLAGVWIFGRFKRFFASTCRPEAGVWQAGCERKQAGREQGKAGGGHIWFRYILCCIFFVAVPLWRSPVAVTARRCHNLSQLSGKKPVIIDEQALSAHSSLFVTKGLRALARKTHSN
jgi:hypothetical protein